MAELEFSPFNKIDTNRHSPEQGGSCSCCRRCAHHTFTFPYDLVTEVRVNNMVMRYCDECFARLIAAVAAAKIGVKI